MSLQQSLYRYGQLSANSIRLLRLLPHQDERAPITCQLFNCVLENSGSCRPYEALSYVWGSNHKPESIAIDGCKLSIGENLFVALLHLRDRSIERILWIDALCINQQDTKEKGHLVVNYDTSWATVFQQVINFILGSALHVETWDNRELAVIRIKGCVLGQVSSFYGDLDREGHQSVRIDWNCEYTKKELSSNLILQPSAKAIKTGDAICLLQGATLPTIIRICKDYWKIITIAAPLPEDLEAVDSDRRLEQFRLPTITIFPHDFLLVWDWDMGLNEFQGGNNYEDMICRITSKTLEVGLQNDLERIFRFWYSGLAMRALQRSMADENLGYALEILENVLRGMDSKALTDLGQAYSTNRDDMGKLQGVAGLLLKGENGCIPLCMAAENGYEAIVKVLLGTGKVDPDASDVNKQTPLWRAAKNGHTTIVKLLLDTHNVDPDAGHNQPGYVWYANDGRTPLSLAAENGHEAIIKLLVDTNKVDLDARSLVKNRTPLTYAAQNGHLGVVKLSLSTDKINLDPTRDRASRFNTETALTVAVIGGHKSIVELLIRAGVMDYEVFGDLCRLLLWAENYGDKEVAEILGSTSRLSKYRKE